MIKDASWNQKMRDRYILIELTDFCNYNCIMCSHGNPVGPHCSPQGFMDRKLFDKIIDELQPSALPRGLKLFWLGEPLLNPAFPEMAHKVVNWLEKNNGKDYLDIHTNGFFLEGEVLDKILKFDHFLPRLTLSLDAARKETYKSIRRGGDLDRVDRNIVDFLKKREALGQYWPTIIFQFIVMDQNMDELGEFVHKWRTILRDIRGKSNKFARLIGLENRPLDVIWIKRVDVSPENRAHAEDIYQRAVKNSNIRPGIYPEVEIIASIDNLWEEPKQRAKVMEYKEPLPDKSPEKNDSFQRNPCSAPFKTPCIRWDGELTICCFDPSMQLSLGNLREKGLDELWYGNINDNIRLAHLEGRFGDIVAKDGAKKCLSCSGYDTPALEADEAKAFVDFYRGKRGN